MAITVEEMCRIRDAAEELRWAEFNHAVSRSLDPDSSPPADVLERSRAAARELYAALVDVTDWSGEAQT